MAVNRKFLKNIEGAIHADSSDKVMLNNSIFDDNCMSEIKEMNKHEIIIKICDIIGPCAANLGTSEKIFEALKFDIANFIIHHEYNSPMGISSDLLLWLDSRVNPKKARKLTAFFNRYLR
jgi:hypothetical protein